MYFSNAARELYGVEPDEFVETRTRLVRQAKDEGDTALAKRLGGLRRPTVGAWAVNLLARSATDLRRLLDVGDELRSAWASGGGLGDLEERRARLLDALLRTAESLAAESGHPLRDQAVREVEDTLQAATVDAGIAAEVREGTLSRPRSHTGFVPAGFPMAPEAEAPSAKPKGGGRKRADEGEPAGRTKEDRPRERTGTRTATERPAAAKKGGRGGTRTSADRERARRAERLRERAAEAARELAEREERAASARDAADRASAEVGRLRHELERAEADRDKAVRKAERAEEARERADEAARGAEQKAGEAERAARGR